MNAAARAALAAIRVCIAHDRLIFTRHFTRRLDQRLLVWPDFLVLFEQPTSVRSGGFDTFGRPQWIVGGFTSDRLPVDVVCALDQDNRGKVTVLITIYFVR